MATLDLIVVIAYMIGALAAGVRAQRRATSQDQFLVAGRSMGPWLYSGTLVLSTVFVKRILGLNLYTVPELLERRYTPSARVAAGVVMVAYSVRPPGPTRPPSRVDA